MHVYTYTHTHIHTCACAPYTYRLCTISTSMVPFTVYNIQRSMGLWPKKDPGVFQGFQVWIRPGWVVMEITTVVVGLVFLWVVRFPFLLFPVSFCLWYLSMDLAPLYPNFERLPYHEMFEIRRRVSLVFGAAMILIGYLLEKSLGSHPDFGFWLYLFGLITFATAMICHLPRDDLFGSMFLLVNMGLVLIGSHLNRTTFYVFGTLGVIEYAMVLFNLRIKVSNSLLLWLLKALTAAALFSQAVRREGNFEVLGGLVCILAFNFNALTLLPSGEVYAVILLLTNLGLVAVTNLLTRPLYLWFFTLPSDMFPVSLICSLSVAMFHASLLIKYLPSRPYTVSGYIYSTYRIAASVVVSFAFVCLRQPHFAWIGGLGIPIVAYCFSQGLRWNSRRQADGYSSAALATANVFAFFVLLLGISFSLFLQSNLLYLICCVAMLMSTLSLLSNWKGFGCVLSVALILLSVPLQSKFMITIGAIYLFLYLSYLAFDVFKNSLLFPLALIFLGLGVIYAGVQYQQRELFIQELFNSWTPTSLQNLLGQNIDSFWEPLGRYDWYHILSKTTFELDNFLQMPVKWLLWSGAVTFALVHGSVPLVSYVCLAGIVMLIVVYGLLEVRNGLTEHLDESVIVSVCVCVCVVPIVWYACKCFQKHSKLLQYISQQYKEEMLVLHCVHLYMSEHINMSGYIYIPLLKTTTSICPGLSVASCVCVYT